MLLGQPAASATVDGEIRRFIETGDIDPMFSVWPGDSSVDRMRRGDAAIRDALRVEMRRRAAGRQPLSLPADVVPVELARSRARSMVTGLFPVAERHAVLEMLARSVVFVTSDNVDDLILADGTWPETAWKLANLYLNSVGAEALSADERLVGFSEETTCYVSTRYFEEPDPFADFVVHEAAHVFHNCKRETLGLKATRTREWLLPIAYRKRETFAYACEAYSRIAASGRTRRDRDRLFAEHAAGRPPSDERVDGAEYFDILREAVAARNGWKQILRRCAPT